MLSPYLDYLFIVRRISYRLSVEIDYVWILCKSNISMMPHELTLRGAWQLTEDNGDPLFLPIAAKWLVFGTDDGDDDDDDDDGGGGDGGNV